MHVVLLSHEYPPFIYGGVGTFVQNLASGLRKKGLHVTVVTGYPALSKGFHVKNFDSEDNFGIDVIRLPYLNLPPSQTFFQLQNMKRIFHVIKNIEPDIIHGQCSSTYPAILGFGRLAPTVVTFHGSPITEKNLASYASTRGGGFGNFRTYVLGYPLMHFIYFTELLNSSCNVAVSETLRSELLDEMGWTFQKKLCAIHNGVDLEMLESGSEKDDLNIDASENVVTYAGRLYWGKGALILINLAYILQRKDPSIKLLIYGNGPLYGRMLREIRKLGLTNIDLKGFASRRQVLQSIKVSKMVLIPSFHEACPLTLLESMCLGKIPIMFDLPYAREFTENGKYGILAKDLMDMASKISYCIEEDSESLSKEIWSFSRKKYNMNSVTEKYCALYSKL